MAEKEEREEHVSVLVSSHPPQPSQPEAILESGTIPVLFKCTQLRFFFMLRLKKLISLWFVLTNNLR